MSRSRISTTVYLTEEQTIALRMLSARTRVPQAVYMRHAVQQLLDEAKKAGHVLKLEPNACASIEPEDARTPVHLERAIERVLARMLGGNGTAGALVAKGDDEPRGK